uniref:Transcription initiation factor IIA gamma subunit N-terminal domain-containing protein n=1 Tax=Parascaris equorum TaxID=6256 RepID=A0A914RXF5_PAREQ
MRLLALFQDGLITPQLAMKVLTTFDKAINKALQVRVKNKVTFRASNSFGDRVDRVKFVACDGRSPSLPLPQP